VGELRLDVSTRPDSFAFFAEFLCALCGQKLLTAKAAKDSAKDAKTVFLPPASM
jgi:hypothetical protein